MANSVENRWPVREVSLNAGTIFSFDNSDKVWSSLQQLAGKGSDYLGIERQWDKNAWGRIAQATFLTYLFTGFQYYKHETAHEMFDGVPKFGIDITDWHFIDSLPPFPYPRYTNKPTPAEPKEINQYVAGLNIDEYTSFTTWRRCMLRQERTFDDSIYFLIHKLDDARYFIFSEIYSYSEEKPLLSDPDTYIYKLNRRGIDLKKPEYGWQIAVSDIFSWYVGESIYSLANYLIRGRRSGKTASLSLADNVAIAPPLTNLYLTEKGSFFNISAFIFIGGDSVEFSTGVDSDFIGGRLDTMRFGGTYYGIHLGPIEVEPFSYIDVERSSFGYKGFSSGARALFPLTDKAAIRVEGQYSDNDVLESLVKETDGPAGHLGVDIKF